MILTVQFAPGSELDESALERMFKVSRTPVREAIVRLASEGLVRSQPNRTAIVAPIGIDAIGQFFEAFDLLQRAVTRWSAVRRTEEQMFEIERCRDAFVEAVHTGDAGRMHHQNNKFHVSIAAASGNDYLAASYKRLLAESYRLAHLTFLYSAISDQVGNEHMRQLLEEHDGITEAVRNRDAARAEVLAHQHTMLFRSQVEAYIRRSLSLDIVPPPKGAP